MKFSYRVIVVVFLLVSIVSLFLFWDEKWMDSIEARSGIKPIHKHTVIDRHFNPNKVAEGNQAQLPVVSGDVCAFASNLSKNADIDTFDIFQSVDNEKMTAGRRGKHMDQFRDKASVKTSSKLPLKIILIPHSHSDPGWHKTVEGYFEDQTRPTLDAMVEKLQKFPNMTFVWAESVFLHMWYKDLDFESQKQVRNLINRRQLEIVGGGWVVPDEANPHYFALVDQLIEGHQWLEQNLGVKPKNTWTLDPFGYSATHPYLYKKAGFENMIILRVHEKLKEQLEDKKALEFYWRQHWDKDHSNDIFTQMMPFRLYNIKHSCGPDPYVCVMFDFRKIRGEMSESRAEEITPRNVEKYAKMLVGQYQIKANMFRHNVVLIPLGDDFRYDRPIEWDQQYKNYMALFNYINRQKDWNVHARFGVLQDYFDEVKKTVAENPLLQETGFPSLQGDFFPYTDENNEYWAGYFTTRPYDKNLCREVEVHIRAAEILNTLAQGSAAENGKPFKLYASNMESLPEARQNLALFQHHDAITGTARSFVVVDYEQRLQSALKTALKVMAASAEYLLKAPSNSIDSTSPKSLHMLYPEKEDVDFDGAGKAEVILFNSVAHRREELVRLTVKSDQVDVYNSYGELVPSQVNPVWKLGKRFTEMSGSVFELIFYAELEALSLSTYTVVISRSPSSVPAALRMYNAQEYNLPPNSRFTLMQPEAEHIVLENEAYKARFSHRTGFLHSITTKKKIMTTEANMEFLMYKSQGSGAYIFNPAGPAVDTEMSTRAVVRVIKGPLTSEVHMVQQLIESKVRLYNTSGVQGQAIEIENVVDVRTKNDKELIMRISTDIKHDATFYTDLNAFQMMKRRRFEKMPPEANYYPTSALAYIEDEHSRLNIISAQPLGVSSQMEGALEIMLDRKLAQDDNRGLGEGVWDNKRTPSRFYLLLERKENKESAKQFPSILAHQLINNLRNYVFAMHPQTTNTSLPSFHPLVQSFPCDMELTNIRSISKDSAALVLHRVGFTCGFPTTSLTCSVSKGFLGLPIEKMFSKLQIKTLQPTSLSLMYNETRSQQMEQMELYAYKMFF